PHAEFLIHPECGCVTSCMYYLAKNDIPSQRSYILSTEGMIKRAKASPAKEFVVATETGIIHRLHKENPGKVFHPVSENAVCKYMKMITLEKVLNSLENMVYEVKVPGDIASRARVAIQRMMQLA
ncbi:MAG: quinolinate synthase NadA, partial [Nitrososphaerales archaeon]